MASSLSFMQMQLSADPDDWCWGRWYWAQPTAVPLSLWTAYGHPLWEDEDNRQRPGPQFRLDSSFYAPSRTTPLPGLFPHGEESWYEDGPPLAARVEEAAGPWCGGELWESEATMSATGKSNDVGPGPSVVASTGVVSTLGIHSNIKPTGTAEGDLIIVFDAVLQVLGIVPPTPAGFTVLSSGTTSGGNLKWKASYKVAGNAEPTNYVVTQGAAHPAISIVATVRGHVGTPVAAAQDGDSVNRECPSVTVDGFGALLLAAFAGFPQAGNAWTAPAGMTLQQSPTPSADAAKLYREELSVPGATGPRLATYGPVSREWVGVTIGVHSPF